MPKLVVQVPRQATASYMPAPGGGTCSWPNGQPLLLKVSVQLLCFFEVKFDWTGT
jgi:hypothetical protein